MSFVSFLASSDGSSWAEEEAVDFFFPPTRGEDSFFAAMADLFGGLQQALKPIIQTALEWAHQLQIPSVFK